MKCWVIFAIIVGAVADEMKLSETPCYKPKNYRTALRIVGGFDTQRNEAPYMVGLMKHGGVVCGASIISENFLILAAHCICNSQNDVVKPTQLKAFVGMHKLSDVRDNQIDDDGAVEVFVNKIIVHPEYVCGKTTQNDIGENRFKIYQNLS